MGTSRSRGVSQVRRSELESGAPTRAMSVHAYIASEAEKMTAARLKELALFAAAIEQKLAGPAAANQPGLLEAGRQLLEVLASAEVRVCRDPLDSGLAEAGVGANYLLKGVDIIPDNVPGIGFSDDEMMLKTIFTRNPSLWRLRRAR